MTSFARQGEDRTFNTERALKNWHKRFPWKLERIAVLERIQIDASRKGHVWTAGNVGKMLKELGA